MFNRDSHLGRSYEDKISYMKKIKSVGEEAKTLPEKDFDFTSASTAEIDLKIEKLENRNRALHNKILNKKNFTPKNMLKGFLSTSGTILISFLLHSTINLNKDMGKVEERVKDIPDLSDKINLIYEKTGKIDKDIGIIKIILEKNDELYKNKFDNLDEKINSINKK